MNFLVLGAFCAVFLASSSAFQNLAAPKTQGEPWPMPQAYSTQSTTVVVDASLVISSNMDNCDIIAQAFQRYKPYITEAECARSKNSKKRSKPKNEAVLTALDVYVKGSCEQYLQPDSDEQYALTVNTPSTQGKASLYASTVWGALRGLETFSQLVYDRGDGILRVNTTLIMDYPRFSFRGAMLDTSRHYLPVRAVLEHLEAMAQNKMNVFHWHIVDDHSFPYVSQAFPDLSKLGAYDDEHVYTPDDVAKVIEFARVRGIRVIPEFDTPGHTESWGPGVPELLTPCYNQGKSTGTFGPVNPILDTTYTFFSQFFTELATVFNDKYIHLGGDEVSFDCWKSNPDVLNFMKNQGMGQNFSLLEEYYEQHIVNIMTTLQKSYIVWQEVFDNQVTLDKSTVINIWKDGYQNELAAVTKAGFNTILSSCWYFNYISYGIDWQKYYTCEPHNFNGTDDQKKLVVGGTACMWAEDVDAENMMATYWPRASTAAERLWSAATVNDAITAAPRLEEHRCRMMKRGLTVEPVNGPGFCTCDLYN